MPIYVSYSGQDEQQVDPLVVELGMLGYDVQYEPKKVGGSLRWQQVFDAISACDVFVFAVTSNSQSSYSRRMECEYAVALGKLAIAVQLQDSAHHGLFFGIPRAFEYRPHDPMSGARFADALRSLPAAEPTRVLIPPPDLNYPITQLYQRISSPSLSPEAKESILFNLKELLERRETRTAAESLLSVFGAGVAPSDPIAGELQALTRKLRNTTPVRRSRLRNVIFGSLMLALIAVAVLFLSGWLAPRVGLNTSRQPAQEIAIPSGSPFSTIVPLLAEATAETLLTVPLASPTPLPKRTTAAHRSNELDA